MTGLEPPPGRGWVVKKTSAIGCSVPPSCTLGTYMSPIQPRRLAAAEPRCSHSSLTAMRSLGYWMSPQLSRKRPRARTRSQSAGLTPAGGVTSVSPYQPAFTSRVCPPSFTWSVPPLSRVSCSQRSTPVTGFSSSSFGAGCLRVLRAASTLSA